MDLTHLDTEKLSIAVDKAARKLDAARALLKPCLVLLSDQVGHGRRR